MGLLEEFRIRLGAPVIHPETGAVMPTDEPHVFFATNLLLMGREEKRGSPTPCINFPTAMVMLGHGRVTEEGWVFSGTKRTVSETLEAYSRTATESGWPPIDIVIACRKAPQGKQKVELILTRRVTPPCITLGGEVKIINDKNRSGRLVEGKGVEGLKVVAPRWRGIKGWQERVVTEPKIGIPDWAKTAAKR